MRKAISKGIDMGMGAMSKSKGGQRRVAQHDDYDSYDDEVAYQDPPKKRQLTPEQKKGQQEARRARRAARQAREAAKVAGRMNRM